MGLQLLLEKGTLSLLLTFIGHMLKTAVRGAGDKEGTPCHMAIKKRGANSGEQ